MSLSEKQLRYVMAMDLTGIGDSQNFIKNLRRYHRAPVRGKGRVRKYPQWTNILNFIPPRQSPHPDFPKMVLSKGILCPFGEIKTGHHAEEAGRHIKIPWEDIKKHSDYMRKYCFSPGIIANAQNKTGQLFGPDDLMPFDGGEIHYPDLMYISSHGWSDGTIRTYLPRKGKDYGPIPMFIDSENILKDKKGDFRWKNGRTKWIVLSLCNVLNIGVAVNWAKSLMGKNGLHGILGYYGVSPGIAGSKRVNQGFLKYARTMPLTEAWKKTNDNIKRPWAIITHIDSWEDSLEEWTSSEGLSEPNRSLDTILYASNEVVNGEQFTLGIPFKDHPCGPITPYTSWWSTESSNVQVQKALSLNILIQGEQYTLHGCKRAHIASAEMKGFMFSFLHHRHGFTPPAEIPKLFKVVKHYVDKIQEIHSWKKGPNVKDSYALSTKKQSTLLELEILSAWKPTDFPIHTFMMAYGKDMKPFLCCGKSVKIMNREQARIQVEKTEKITPVTPKKSLFDTQRDNATTLAQYLA